MPAARSSPSGAFVEGPERAFTRRQPGVNPIALELDRLAEQRALQMLGTPRQPSTDPRLSPADADPRTWTYAPNEDRTATDAPAASDAEIDAELRANAVAQAAAPFQYDPGDPQWGGLEEDEAHKFWADRLTETAKRYPTMDDIERQAFQRAFQDRGWVLPGENTLRR